MHARTFAASFAALLMTTAATPARADDAFRVAAGKAEILPVAGQAGSARVADPKIADVVADNHRVLVMGKKPGETELLVLDGNGQTLLKKKVRVVAHADTTLRIEVSKAELLQLDTPPGSVLIADPKIADVVADGSRHLFVLGKVPGETKLFVLDSRGQPMLEKRVRVVAGSSGVVTVFRGSTEVTLECAPRCDPPPDLKQGGATATAAAAPQPQPTAPAAAPPAAPPPAPAAGTPVAAR